MILYWRLIGIILLLIGTDSGKKWDIKSFCLYAGIIVYVNAMIEYNKEKK